VNTPDSTGLPSKPPQHTRELLDLLDVVESQEVVTQRTLAERVGVAVGLANALVRRAARKGFIKISQAPVRRYAYYLTPEGFAEKSRLVSEYLFASLSFFRRARREYLELFDYCSTRHWHRVVFAGAGELAEIALLAAHESGMTIVGVIDTETNQNRIAGLPVIRTLEECGMVDAVIITNSRKPFECYNALVAQFPADHILAPALLRLRRLAPQES
jgi:DNA-binding MarR family transcriptional regulator